VDDIAVGRGVRALRRRKGWSQRELGVRAGVHKSVVCDIESGRLELVRLPTVRRVAKALGVGIEIAPRWPIADVARLLDADHAALVERVVRMLTSQGWETLIEYTFNDFGDRGSVDVLGWHPGRRALVLVEIKTRVADVQALHAAFDRKARVVPRLVARDRGWRPDMVGMLLVVADRHPNRDALARHAKTFEARFPSRSREARRWIREPVGNFAGVLFLPEVGASQRSSARRRSDGR
jgi:transcriptional regulator with XRE-family HTH domain